MCQSNNAHYNVKKVVPHQIYKLNIYLLLKLDPFSEWLTGWILDQVSSGQVYGVIINCESPPKQHPRCGEILFFSKILCFLGKCEENLVFLKKFSIFLKSLYSHFEKMWRKYCPFLQNWDFFSKLISLLKFAKLKKTWWFFLKMIILYSNLLKFSKF